MNITTITETSFKITDNVIPPNVRILNAYHISHIDLQHDSVFISMGEEQLRYDLDDREEAELFFIKIQDLMI